MAEIISFPGGVDSSLDGKELNKLEVKALLEHAKERQMSGVLILSVDEDGELYIDSNINSERTLIWAIEKFKKVVLDL